MSSGKILVAFFSRADENWAVGRVTEGNTQKVAEVIAKELGADLFHIDPVKPYPAAYDTAIEVAKREMHEGGRPEIKGDSPVEDYSTIFLGYPMWWGELPMPCYTFIEKHNWEGKTVIPFCTHEGSGIGGTESKVKSACKGSHVLSGLAVQGTTAQKNKLKTRQLVQAWLKKLGISK